MVAKRRVHETHVETLARLGRQARAAGVQIFWDEITHRPFATSRRNPSLLHQVSAISCTCEGFIRTGACGHIGMLLLELGYLPTDPGPTPPAITARPSGPAVLCDQCGEPMAHINGVAFECQCGATFEPAWEVADRIEMAVCAADPEEVERVASMLAPNGIPYYGGDPDNYPDRSDVPGFLGLSVYSANELAAVLIWQTDRQDVAERFAA